MISVGLMSGTSLDGVDAALVRIVPRATGYHIELLRFQTYPFEPDLRAALLAALPPNSGSTAAIANLHNALGHAYAQAARAVKGSERVGYVASHGQTMWHDGASHVTLQIGDPFLIREQADATVCYDFRSADCAAGGHGAPLVAFADALLLSNADEDRVALNLGGIANVTLLRKGAPAAETIAFDTGPANILIDAFVHERTGGTRSFDRDGALAAAGRVDRELLDAMLADQYFALAPPKTTGRERFGAQFLARHEPMLQRLSLEDGAATLTELTAASASDAIARAGFDSARIIVSGGGARNSTLWERLVARLESARVEISDAMGLPAEAKEAMAFTVLGYETLRGRASNVAAATGARHPALLGGIAPRNLRDLLAEIELECDCAKADRLMSKLPKTEEVNPRSVGLDLLSTSELVELIVADQRDAVDAAVAQSAAIADVVEAIAMRLESGGTLHYFGAGTSARVAALDAAEMPPTFGTAPDLVRAHVAGGAPALIRAIEGAEDDVAGGEAIASDVVKANDAAIGISASGSAAFVVAAVERAREIGAYTVAITSVAGSALAHAAQSALVLDTGAEVVAGSTRLKAGTAQKIALNAISTAVMVRLGKVHDNLMVDVVASNRKLRARALRLVRALAHVDEARAKKLLEAADGRVKVAVVMEGRGVDAAQARALLQQHGGVLRKLL
jgi:anhydro-N-acetylmuramic acid kinase